jgi:hypothetical protein
MKKLTCEVIILVLLLGANTLFVDGFVIRRWITIRRKSSIAAVTTFPSMEVLYPLPDFSSAIDLSPQHDRTLLKLITNRGDSTKSLAEEKDRVFMQWCIYDEHGVQLHTTNELPSKGFHFSIGRANEEVVLAWEVVARTMLPGEQAMVYSTAHHAFGETGVPSKIPPNSTLIISFLMTDILRASAKSWKHTIATIENGEDIAAEWSSRIREGYDPSESDFEMSQRESYSKIGSDRLTETETVIPNDLQVNGLKSSSSGTNHTGPIHHTSTSNEDDIIMSHSASTSEPRPEKKKRKFFDATTHTLDPRRELFGSSFGHRWKETPDLLEIDVAVPKTSKRQLQVLIRSVFFQL